MDARLHAYYKVESTERRSTVGLLSEEVGMSPAWTLSEVEEVLLDRMRGATVSETERSSSTRLSKEEGICWWILSAFDSLDGKEAREAYYARL